MDYVTPLSRDQGARALSSPVCRQVSPVIAIDEPPSRF
jgi:hypothetical protein